MEIDFLTYTRFGSFLQAKFFLWESVPSKLSKIWLISSGKVFYGYSEFYFENIKLFH